MHVVRSNDAHLQWNVRNEGTMIFLSGSYPSVRSALFQSFFSNNGTVGFYAISPSFSFPTLVRASGAWKMYGVPARQSNLPSVSWQDEYASTFDYKRYIYDLYQNSTRDVYDGKTLWRDNSVSISFSATSTMSHRTSSRYKRMDTSESIYQAAFRMFDFQSRAKWFCQILLYSFSSHHHQTEIHFYF